jgi:hypothetical protein
VDLGLELFLTVLSNNDGRRNNNFHAHSLDASSIIEERAKHSFFFNFSSDSVLVHAVSFEIA